MRYLWVLSLFVSLSVFGSEGDCESKVIGHYKDVYHKTYKAASNTFLNNFVGGKNATAHMLGYPEVAFRGFTLTYPNEKAESLMRKSKRSAETIVKVYRDSLRSGDLCQALGGDYKKSAKVKKYLLESLKDSEFISSSINNNDRGSLKELNQKSVTKPSRLETGASIK